MNHHATTPARDGLSNAREAMLRTVARRGSALAGVFVDGPVSRVGAAFDALVEVLRRPHIHAVVVPSPELFSRFGGVYRAMCTVVAVETGVAVLFMSGGGAL